MLGVIIDTQLNFNEHIDNLCKKLTQRIAVLKKIRRHLPLDQRILYYNAMIKQTMMYGSSVWVSTSVDNLNKVFRLQKRAARVILNADTRANSVDLFRDLNWLPFFHEAKINQCAIVYKRLNGVCPDYMLELLKRNIDIRSTEILITSLFICICAYFQFVLMATSLSVFYTVKCHPRKIQLIIIIIIKNLAA